VRWLIGFVPGGGADTVVRIMGRWLSDRLNQPFIIENKPGAATNVSVQAAINSPEARQLLKVMKYGPQKYLPHLSQEPEPGNAMRARGTQ
jgi:tripartite-type tricarboxylate transporter receptor subunit TctC